MRIYGPTLALTLVGLLASGAALAQAAPPPPAGPAAADAAAQPAPPPPGDATQAALPPPPPRGGPGAPPPPPGPHVVLDRGANGFAHVDVKCAERESTQDCAGIAARMLDKLAGR